MSRSRSGSAAEAPSWSCGAQLYSGPSLLARAQGCYKVTLNCADPMVKFYNGFGFRCEDGDANFMALRL